MFTALPLFANQWSCTLLMLAQTDAFGRLSLITSEMPMGERKPYLQITSAAIYQFNFLG